MGVGVRDPFSRRQWTMSLSCLQSETVTQLENGNTSSISSALLVSAQPPHVVVILGDLGGANITGRRDARAGADVMSWFFSTVSVISVIQGG